MNLQNHFLIAMPSLQDPFFKRSVVYICEHTEEGTMGLVINKPADQFTIADLLKKLAITPKKTDPLFSLDKPVMIGGPLAEDRGFILHSPQEFNASLFIADDVMVTTSKDVLESLGSAQQPKHYMVMLGYSSWQVGQLQQEIRENHWLTVAADPTLLFTVPIAERWHTTARKLGIDIHNIATTFGHA